MNYKEYVKKFSKIKVTSICNKLNINKGNLFSGKCKEDNYIKVKEEIEKEIAKLYLEV